MKNKKKITLIKQKKPKTRFKIIEKRYAPYYVCEFTSFKCIRGYDGSKKEKQIKNWGYICSAKFEGVRKYFFLFNTFS